MAKITYTKLKLKTNEEIKTFTFNEQEIEVRQYLPIDSKYDLIMSTLHQSLEDNIYNSLKLYMFFHVYLVFLYTNISFTDKQKENMSDLYDALKSNGIIDSVLMNIPEEEYNTLYNYLEENAKKLTKSKNSVTSLINNVIKDLPTQAQAAMDIVNNFDKEKFQEVVNFAKAANNGKLVK